MAERVLSTRALNRALLARQQLLERSTRPLGGVIEGMGEVQSQYAPAAYVSLWSRMEGFSRQALTRALERRRVVQATVMRVTIHMVTARDYWPLTEGVREPRRTWWLRQQRGVVDAATMERVADLVRSTLGDGPRRHTEMVQAVEAAGFPRVAWQGAGLWVDMVRVPPSGTWERRRADLYGLADAWLGPSSATEEDGRRLLLRRYLGAFGPAPLRDAANWAGVPVVALQPAVASLRLRRFRDEEGGELLDLPGAPLPDPDTPAPVRFLPVWDASLLVHARRTAILPEQYRGRIFNTKNPQSFATVLVDGAVAGVWRHEDHRITVEPFAPLDARVRRELDEEAERLAAFHGDDA